MAEPAHEHVEPAHSHIAPTPVAAGRTWSWAGIAVRVVLTLVGAAGLIVSAFMDWIQGHEAFHINVRGLWSTTFDHPGSNWLTAIAVVLVGLGLLAIVGLAPRTGWLTSLAGALGIALFVMLLVQMYRTDLTVNDLDPGAWIGLAGSVVGLIAGFFGTRTAVMVSRPTAVVP